MKKFITATIITALAASAATAVFAETDVQEQHGLGALPIYTDIGIRKPAKSVKLFGEDELPAKFDLRNVDGNGKSYISSVKDQWGTENCWAYAFAASAESCWLKETDGGEEIDVSEDHIDYSTTKTISDQDNPDGGKNKLNTGGQPFMAASYTSRGSGVVLEDDFQYSYGDWYGEEEDTNPIGYLSNIYVKPSFGITDVILSNYFDNNDSGELTDEYYDEMIEQMKNDLYTNKTAVTTSILYDDECFGSLYPTFYNPDGGYNKASHSVTIVGWDDTYPKEYFNTMPKGDGAWIIKDSYGTDIEGRENGYFYLSYYDLSGYCINTQVTGMEDYRDGLPYDNRYYNDKDWFQDSLGYEDNNNTAYGMNVFKKQDGVENVVSVNLAFNGPTEYEVYIADDTDDIDVSSLTPCLTGTKDRAGYYELDLDTTATVSGDSFAVIVKYHDSDGYKIVPVSQKSPYPYWWYDYNLTFTAGTSFISADGSDWEDISAQNKACAIKAFTTDVNKKSVVTIKKTSTDEYTDLSETMVWVYDEEGNRITTNADGTYSLVNGNYTYLAERVPDWQKNYETVSGSFSVSGDMTLEVPVPENLITVTVTETAPSVSNTSLIKINPYLLDRTNISVNHSYGNGEKAATDATLYLVDDNGEKKILEKGKDYDITSSSIYLSKPPYASANPIYYMLSDNEFLYDHRDSLLTYEIVYNDEAQTTDRFYIYVEDLDMLKILNTYIATNSDATENSIENYLIDSIKGTDSVTFSDDFEITPMSIKGKVTVVNGGKTYEQDYNGYTRKLSNMKFIKKTKDGLMYKLNKLDFNGSAYDMYTTPVYYTAAYDENGLQTNIQQVYYFSKYITVPYEINAKTLKLFIWQMSKYYAGKNNTVQIPLTDAVETTIPTIQ